MRIKLIHLLVICFAIVFSSCKLLNPSKMFDTPADYQYSEFKDLDKEYKIKPFDKLQVIITTNDGANLINYKGGSNSQMQGGMEYIVEYDGKVKLPSLGRIEIAGLTIREAEKKLEKEYSSLYQSPFVIIKVTNRRVFIFADGGTDGSVLNLEEENTTLIEAIAQTGGLSFDSKSYKIKLIRGDINNSPEVYIYNIYNLKDMQKANLLLKANDIIYIESKPRYATRILTEISPYLSLTTTILLVYGMFF